MSRQKPDSYTQFLAVRGDYISRERVASEHADHVLIAGAAGALALSVTFIEKIAANPIAATRPILAAGWLLLLASLGMSLGSYVLRSRAYQHAREILDNAVLAGELELSKVDLSTVTTRNRWLIWLLHVRLWTLVFGVISVVLFAFVNVPFAQR